MRNDQGRPIAHQLLECRLNRQFALGIERRGRLVEQQDRRILQYGAGNRQSLALAEHAHHGGASFTAVTAVAATLPTGFAILMNASLVTSIMQRATPSDHREPMFTLLAVVPLIVGPVAQVVVGQLSDRTSIPISLAVMSVLTVTLSFLVSHRDLRPHLQLLDEHEVAPHVNAMGGQRSAHRSHHHFTAWVTPSTDVP